MAHAVIFLPCLYEHYHIPDKGAFTFGGTWTQLLGMETVAGASLFPCLPLLEHRPLVEVREVLRFNRNGASALHVIEQEKSELKVFEMDLVSYNLNLRIRKKLEPVWPDHAAGTFLKTTFACFNHYPTASS